MAPKRSDNVGSVADDLGEAIDFFCELGLAENSASSITSRWPANVARRSWGATVNDRAYLLTQRGFESEILENKGVTAKSPVDHGGSVMLSMG